MGAALYHWFGFICTPWQTEVPYCSWAFGGFIAGYGARLGKWMYIGATVSAVWRHYRAFNTVRLYISVRCHCHRATDRCTEGV